MGYAKRKEIFDNHTKMPLAPAPLDSRFELPSELCPLVSTKHKRTPGVSFQTYSPRKFFTDQIKDYPFSSFRPKADKPLVKDKSPKEGKMPVDIENAPQIAKLFAKDYGYKVCMLKPDRFVSEKKKKVENNPIFKQLVNFEQEEEMAKDRQRNKKKPYA